jgi:hypothetical protein
MIFGLVFALIVAIPPQDNSADSRAAMQRAQDTYERHRQAALRINDLAARIHSQADAETIVAEIATLFENELPPLWATGSIRTRVAHAEYEAVSDPAKLIPEQRIADVWNQYAREIGAPDEVIVSTAEIHDMRDASFTTSGLMWARGHQTIWMMPNVYALGADGKVANGCRALDAIRVIHDLDGLFQNLISARERLKKGIVLSETLKKLGEGPKTPLRATAHVEARRPFINPIRPAEQHYVQEHGSLAFAQLLGRLFDELFPAE